MLFFHPLIQGAATLLACYVFYLGTARFQSLHRNRARSFKWKRHVALGATAFLILLLGGGGGLFTARLSWGHFLLTNYHAAFALAVLPLILLGFTTGAYMNRVKKPRKNLPLIHGITNLMVLGFLLALLATGIEVYWTLVLGK